MHYVMQHVMDYVIHDVMHCVMHYLLQVREGVLVLEASEQLACIRCKGFGVRG